MIVHVKIYVCQKCGYSQALRPDEIIDACPACSEDKKYTSKDKGLTALEKDIEERR